MSFPPALMVKVFAAPIFIEQSVVTQSRVPPLFIVIEISVVTAAPLVTVPAINITLPPVTLPLVKAFCVSVALGPILICAVAMAMGAFCEIVAESISVPTALNFAAFIRETPSDDPPD